MEVTGTGTLQPNSGELEIIAAGVETIRQQGYAVTVGDCWRVEELQSQRFYQEPDGWTFIPVPAYQWLVSFVTRTSTGRRLLIMLTMERVPGGLICTDYQASLPRHS